MSAVWSLHARPGAARTLRWYLAAALRRHPWLALGMFSTSVATGLLRGSELWALRYAIDALLAPAPATERLRGALLWVGCIGLAHLLMRLLEMLQSLMRSQLEFGLATHLRGELLEVAARTPLLTMEQPAFRDALHQAGEAGPALGGLLNLLLLLGADLFAFLAYAGLVVTVHPLFPLVLGLAILPVIGVRLATGSDYQSLLNERTTEHRRLDYLTSLFFQRNTFAEVKLFGLQTHLLGGWDQRSGRLRRERVGRVAKHQLASFTGNFLIVAAAVLGFWLGIRGVLAGLMTLGAFVASMEALNRAMSQIQTMVNYFGFLQRDLLRLSPFMRVIISAPPGATDDATEGEAPPAIREIRFEQVSFTYPGATAPTLTNLSLVLAAGERVALVGANGAGKSTLAALLLGLCEPTSGRILIDGVDRRSLAPAQRQALVSAVFQGVVQYQLPLREQLQFFGPDQPDEQLQRSLGAAGLERLATGWPVRAKQRIGKLFGGIELSGGQWQKLAVARGLARTAPILVVDEPTAALDPQAEVALFASCLQRASDRLTVLISHRLGVCTQVDRVLVLDGGQIVEDGHHRELVGAGGLYARFWEAQAAWYR